MTDELLPCPFCGTTDDWISQLNGMSRCAECGCTCKTEYWNTRTQPSSAGSVGEDELLDIIAEKQANGWEYGTHPRDKARIVLDAIRPHLRSTQQREESAKQKQSEAGDWKEEEADRRHRSELIEMSESKLQSGGE